MSEAECLYFFGSEGNGTQVKAWEEIRLGLVNIASRRVTTFEIENHFKKFLFWNRNVTQMLWLPSLRKPDTQNETENDRTVPGLVICYDCRQRKMETGKWACSETSLRAQQYSFKKKKGRTHCWGSQNETIHINLSTEVAGLKENLVTQWEKKELGLTPKY